MKIGKINVLDIASSAYASLLTEVDKPPAKLYIAGTMPAERRPTVAIVGTRRPTAYGREVAHTLATELTRRGVVIVSGLALGIDAIAHTACLEAGGTTIAVLANGLHRIYPVTNTRLAERIVASGGAIVSEQAMGVDAHKYHFLSRNRLVSGLADAVVVVEAADRSGTFSTVGHALLQGKEVFAVPGPITSLLSVGPNRILQQGARVVLNEDDILSVIAPQLKVTQTVMPLGDTPLETDIINLIQSGVRQGDELLQQSGASASEFLQALTMLELNGTIKSQGGNRWSL